MHTPSTPGGVLQYELTSHSQVATAPVQLLVLVVWQRFPQVCVLLQQVPVVDPETSVDPLEHTLGQVQGQGSSVGGVAPLEKAPPLEQIAPVAPVAP
jgi:hypothetical protein